MKATHPRIPLTQSDPALTGRLQRNLRDARAVAQRLPDVPSIALYLINPDFRSERLTADETRAILEAPAYWAFCWASGQVLARYLLDHPEWAQGKTVADFGAGSGVVGIAAARAGAARVIVCDIDPDALLACRRNAELNEVAFEYCSDFDQLPASVDLLVAADVLYDRANLGWLDRFRARARHILVADSRVRDFAEPGYRQVLNAESSTWPNLDEFDEFRRVNVYAASGVPGTV